MSITAVKSYFKELGLEDRVLEFSVSSATVALAAQAVGCEEARIAKTLSFLVDGHAVLIVTAGDAKIDNRKFKDQFHTKAKMLTAEELAALVGHAPGGGLPLSVPIRLRSGWTSLCGAFPPFSPPPGAITAPSSFPAGSLSVSPARAAGGSLQGMASRRAVIPLCDGIFCAVPLTLGAKQDTLLW